MDDKTYKKYLSVDYGTKRVGLASGTIFPAGLGVIDASKGEDFVLEEIKKILDTDDFDGIVIGLPVRSQGEAGTLDSQIRAFGGKLLTSSGLDIFLEEEEFSSSEARDLLISNKKKFQRQTGEIDELAAIIILERFFDRNRNMPSIKPDMTNEG